jgi:hypothetical protein
LSVAKLQTIVPATDTISAPKSILDPAPLSSVSAELCKDWYQCKCCYQYKHYYQYNISGRNTQPFVFFSIRSAAPSLQLHTCLQFLLNIRKFVFNVTGHILPLHQLVLISMPFWVNAPPTSEPTTAPANAPISNLDKSFRLMRGVVIIIIIARIEYPVILNFIIKVVGRGIKSFYTHL